MTRYPEPGVAKTRLAEAVGEVEAARLHSEIARYCVRRMHAVAIAGDAELEVRASGASSRQVRRWLGRSVRVRRQGSGDLGARLAEAMRVALAEGAPSVVVVGSDAPGLGGAHVRDALEALREEDVVLGPASDGGYYLAGVRASAAERAVPALFGGEIPWGSAGVLATTLGSIERAGLSVAHLSELADVDREDDLPVWEGVRAERERVRTDPQLSVVIPALDEQARIADAIESAHAAGVGEVIVADGGSADRTVGVARNAGALVLAAPRGRAAQLAAGAHRASGDVLLFLHADSRLPQSALDDVQATLSGPDIVLGAFAFNAGDPSRPRDRFMSWGGRMRHGFFGLPYGDQGQFIRRQDLEDLGGIPQMPTMEDWELAVRCKRLGKLGVAPSRLWTSGRAWQEHGALAVIVMNSAVIVGYRLGVRPEKLAAWRAVITPEA